jgi:cytochrome o ubiquinol oxidase subunit 1
MPKSSPVGFISAFFAVFLGFGLIWHIWWLVIGALVCAIGVLLWHAWNTDRDMHISAGELEEFDRQHPSLGAQL